MSKTSRDKIRDGNMILNAVPGIGPITLGRLLEHFDYDPLLILNASEPDLMKVRGIGEQSVRALQKMISSNWLPREKERLLKTGARFLCPNEFPPLLHELNDTPIGLYALGTFSNAPCVAIVGTRIPSAYGKKLAYRMAYDLALAGICVVSGMARGIDSEAHRGALDAGGQTVAFLGSGLDIVYPPENLNLYRKIRDSGAILSEFPLGKRADRRTFPMRNRLVAGASLGVVVIESAKSGGSMITARFAAEQGKEVFALPGRVDQVQSQGCLDLIRDGATLVRNAIDVVQELLPTIGNPEVQEPQGEAHDNGLDSLLEEEERTIMNVLAQGELIDVDRLIDLTGIPLSQIVPALSMLEIKGMARKRHDGTYESA